MSEGGKRFPQVVESKTNQVGASLPPRRATLQLYRGCEDGWGCFKCSLVRGKGEHGKEKKRKPACRWGLFEQRSDRCAAARTTALSPTQDSFNEAQTLCHVGAHEVVLVVAEDASEDSDSGVRFGRSAIMGFEPSVGRHAGCCLQVQWANVLSGTLEGCTYR